MKGLLIQGYYRLNLPTNSAIFKIRGHCPAQWAHLLEPAPRHPSEMARHSQPECLNFWPLHFKRKRKKLLLVPTAQNWFWITLGPRHLSSLAQAGSLSPGARLELCYSFIPVALESASANNSPVVSWGILNLEFLINAVKISGIPNLFSALWDF